MTPPVLPDALSRVRLRRRHPLLLALLVIFSACMPLRYPRDGEPVSVRPGEALVFGRIRMFGSDGETKGKASSPYEFFPFSTDPMDHMLNPDPVMSLELRRFEPPGGAFVYKAFPLPAVGKHGAFRWILPAGDYLLASNPRIYGSARFNPRETAELARFTVTPGGGTVYLGTLIVTIGDALFDLPGVFGKGETEYVIRGLRVVDEREEELPELRARFPALPEPVATRLMNTE
jgi:hypothetical protein